MGYRRWWKSDSEQPMTAEPRMCMWGFFAKHV
jgi:hypothetical protein